jgi:hypothetical protein
LENGIMFLYFWRVVRFLKGIFSSKHIWSCNAVPSWCALVNCIYFVTVDDSFFFFGWPSASPAITCQYQLTLERGDKPRNRV